MRVTSSRARCYTPTGAMTSGHPHCCTPTAAPLFPEQSPYLQGLRDVPTGSSWVPRDPFRALETGELCGSSRAHATAHGQSGRLGRRQAFPTGGPQAQGPLLAGPQATQVIPLWSGYGRWFLLAWAAPEAQIISSQAHPSFPLWEPGGGA